MGMVEKDAALVDVVIVVLIYTVVGEDFALADFVSVSIVVSFFKYQSQKSEYYFRKTPYPPPFFLKKLNESPFQYSKRAKVKTFCTHEHDKGSYLKKKKHTRKL